MVSYFDGGRDSVRLGVSWIGVLTLMIVLYKTFPVEYIDLITTNLQQAHLLDVEALIWVESRFQDNALSKAGAYGLMQLMPETARWLKDRYGMSGNWMESEKNLLLGILYFEELIQRYQGNVLAAVEAYNVGPAAYDAGKRNAVHRYKYFLVRFVYQLLYEIVGQWG